MSTFNFGRMIYGRKEANFGVAVFVIAVAAAIFWFLVPSVSSAGVNKAAIVHVGSNSASQTTKIKPQTPNGIPKNLPSIKNKECPVPPLPDWSGLEAWLWNEICLGSGNAISALSFNEWELDEGAIKSADVCASEKFIAAEFLQTILLYKPYREAVPHYGVRLENVRVVGVLDFSSAELVHELWLDYSCFEDFLDFRSAHLKKDISFSGSILKKGVSFELARADGSITFNDNAYALCMKINSARIGNELNFNKAKILELLNLNASNIEGALFADRSKIGILDLVGATVSENVEFQHAIFSGTANMDQLTVGGSILLTGAEFRLAKKVFSNYRVSRNCGKSKDIDINPAYSLKLRAVRATGNVFLNRTKFVTSDAIREVTGSTPHRYEYLDLRQITVGGSLILETSKFANVVAWTSPSVNLGNGVVNGDVRFAGSHIEGVVDAQLLKVMGNLRLWSKDKKKAGAVENKPILPNEIDLRNASVGIFHFQNQEWPETLGRKLFGFSYDRLDLGTGVDAVQLIDWLSVDKKTSAQPYRYLAEIVTQQGEEESAKEILIAFKDRERTVYCAGVKQIWADDGFPETLGPSLGCVWRVMLEFVMGYGYQPWKAIWLVLVLWGIGAVVFEEEDVETAYLWAIAKDEYPPIHRLAYSLDMLIPLVSFREAHVEKVNPRGLRFVYYSVHKVLGYVLALLLLAGVSGLTK